jgi:hypothetical protein
MLAPLALCMLPLLHGCGGNAESGDTATPTTEAPAKDGAATQGASGTEVPSTEAITTLHKETMEVFVKSLAAKDMTEYHGSLAKIAQDKFTPAQLSEGYKPLMANAAEFGQLTTTVKPVFEPEPSIEKSQLVVAGYYDSDPRLTFTTKYYNEDGVWKPTNVTVKTVAAPAAKP